MDTFDVVVAGSGNAGMSAALAAAETGARVCLIEKSPREWAGGNSYFTAGAYRMAYQDQDKLFELVGEPSETVDVPPYPPEEYLADMQRETLGRTDLDLAQVLVTEAAEGARWLAGHGVAWELMYLRQSFRTENGTYRFWGNLPVGAVGGGKGLVERELAALNRLGVEVRFDSPLVGLVRDSGSVGAVEVGGGGGGVTLETSAVVLSAGGFQGDPRLRASYLGPGWDLAKLRGTPYSTGDGIGLAIDIGAQPYGHWSGAHAIAWDAAAPLHGDRELTNRFSRQAYPFGLIVNRHGKRFVDEGAEFRNYTYAKYGHEVLRQPGAIAYQVFDAATSDLLSPLDYSTAEQSRFQADTLEELARLAGIDAEPFCRTVDQYNAAVQPGKFDPTVKDGKGTVGIDPPKTNWAQPLTTPPFVAYAVTCGLTFTFGGVRIDDRARVIDTEGRPIPGLYACGEMAAGLFYYNYPGGSGLAAGTVFGRRAGKEAAVFGSSAEGDSIETKEV